jgi:hypothetical protein
MLEPPLSYNDSIADKSHSEMYGYSISIVGYIKSSIADECANPIACPNS